MFCSYFWIFSAQTFTSSRRYAHFWIIGTVIKQCHQVLAVATNNSISHLVGILNLCLVIKKIDLCCLIVKEMAKVSYHITLPRILSTQVFSLSYIILIVWRPLREGREIWTFSNQNAAYCDKNHLSMALYTLQIPNSYYEKKTPSNRQEFTCFA